MTDAHAFVCPNCGAALEGSHVACHFCGHHADAGGAAVEPPTFAPPPEPMMPAVVVVAPRRRRGRRGGALVGLILVATAAIVVGALASAGALGRRGAPAAKTHHGRH